MIRDLTRSIRWHEIRDNIGPFLNAKENVLDIGCDTGFITEKFNHVFGCYMFGADVEMRLKNKAIFWILINNGVIDTWRRFDTALLIDVLHHVPYEKQAALIREAQRVADRVIILESEPSWIVRLTDWTQRKSIPNPGAYRTHKRWSAFLLLFGFYSYPITKSRWYPIRHCMFTWEVLK